MSIQVRVRLLVTNLHELSTTTQTFKCSIHLEASWLDPEITSSDDIISESSNARSLWVGGQ